MSLRRGVISLGVAAGILVGGYSLVNHPIKGTLIDNVLPKNMEAGIPFYKDQVVTDTMDVTTYESNNAEVTTGKEYITSSDETNILEYESYTPTHQDSDGKFTRNKTTYRVSNLSDEELQYYIDEFQNNGGSIYVDGEKEEITVDEAKGSYSALKVSKLNEEERQERLQTDQEDAYDVRFAGTLGLAAILGGLYAHKATEEKPKVKTKKELTNKD